MMKGFIAATFVILLSGCVSSPQQGKEVGNIAPDFTLQTSTGSEITLSDFTGKPVVVHFFDTFCSSCKEDSINFAKVYPKYKDNVEYIGIFIDPWEKSEFINTYVEEMDMEGNFAPSNQKVVLDYFAISPTLKYVIDGDGVIVLKDTGMYTQEEWTNVLDSVI